MLIPGSSFHSLWGTFGWLYCNCYDTADERFKSLSMRGPGRRDTCHLTDFFQSFTVYEGH